MHKLKNTEEYETETAYLRAIDLSKLTEFLKEFWDKDPVSYSDISKILDCDSKDIQTHTFANFLYFSLLYIPYKFPLNRTKGSQNLMTRNRIRGSSEWASALVTADGRHKSFIGRVAFSKDSQFFCHPSLDSQMKRILVREDEFRIGSQGMYGPVPIFSQFSRQEKTKIFVPQRKTRKETHKEKLEKLRFLGLVERRKVSKGYEYDLQRYQNYFASAISSEDFRRAFSRYVIRNDFQIQRVIIAMYFLEKKNKSYVFIPCFASKNRKRLRIRSAKRVYPLSLYANLGPKCMDSVLQFTHFSGLDHYYIPPTMRKPEAKICLFLAAQVSTLSDLLILAKRKIDEEKNWDLGKKALGYGQKHSIEKKVLQLKYLKHFLLYERNTSDLVKKIDKYLEQEKSGCIIDLDLPVPGEPTMCPSNIFVLTTLLPNKRVFYEKISHVLAEQVDKTLYYPYFRFTCCTRHGWHRYDFDKLFAGSLPYLRKKFVIRFYAIGRPGDRSHEISPLVIRSVGRVFDHFKVLRRE